MGDMHWTDLGVAAQYLWLVLLVVVVLAVIEISWKSKWMQHPSVEWLKWLAAFLRWLLVAVAFIGIFLATRPLRDLESKSYQKALPAPSSSSTGAPGAANPPSQMEQANKKSQNPPSTPPANEQGTAAKASPEEEAIKANIEELKWLLTILAGFAVITAIAQAAAAWFSALTYDKQASAKLEEIDKALESFRARYPIFHEVEEKRNQAHDALSSTLRKVFGAADLKTDPTEAIFWIQDFYHEIDLEKRQQLLSVESFASIDLHPAHRGSEVENLKLFAVFYHAKFRYEKGMKAAALFTDLERAESYLLLAVKKNPFDFTLHNELGNIYMTMRESTGELSSDYPNYLNMARDAFLKSSQMRPDQQRAYYNLAYIQSAYHKDYDKARDLLKEALRYKTWQRVVTPDPMAAYVYYNLGCAWARILVRDHQGSSPIDMKEAEPAISALRKISEIAPILAEDVERDFTSKTEGDIYGLYERGDKEVRTELDRLRSVLAEAKKPRQRFKDKTIAEAFESIWNFMKEVVGAGSQTT
jgi:tetratricopeptide (TPR) repeat protein